MTDRRIVLRGVRVHNLRNVDLDLPARRMIVFCGVSGSGKSSLAVDTLYAEGQRRYIESFSPYARQFLERLEKPDADRIEGIPPAVAVTGKDGTPSLRATVGSATEILDYLRLFLAKVGRVFCDRCGREVRRDSPQTTVERLLGMPEGTRAMITFPISPEDADVCGALAAWKKQGYFRVVANNRMVDLSESDVPPEAEGPYRIVVDRVSLDESTEPRLLDSVEASFDDGNGECDVFVAAETAAFENDTCLIDSRPWRLLRFSRNPSCAECGIAYPEPEPRLLSFNSPLGACAKCEGIGTVPELDLDLIVPNPRKTLAAGAIQAWTVPAYAKVLDTLLRIAPKVGIPVDVPFRDLTEHHIQTLIEGVPEKRFPGLNGLIASLESAKSRRHAGGFSARWRSMKTCDACGGTRLCDEARAVRVAGRNIAQIAAMKVNEARKFFESLQLAEWEERAARLMLEQIGARLRYLDNVGLSYLTLDRPLRTLSGGEARRIALTSALGSSLVNMLFVLDEPSIGLHPRDVRRLLDAIEGLRDRGNTVVVVEHEEAFLRGADEIVEIGPGAGERGGNVVFQGSVDEMREAPQSLTGDYLAGRRGRFTGKNRNETSHGCIRLAGAKGNNLRDLNVVFPLGVLCCVTGPSGAGKSTLVRDTLYPALCRRLRKDAPKPLPYDDVYGDGQIDDILLVDQGPLARTPRSNPVTYLKVFDEIRAVFAETVEARTRNFSASHFSFNVEGGRCERCRGDGFIPIDMQFLADVYMRCPECRGRRYKKEILSVHYRGKNIAEVLEMTVREAFAFFRGSRKVQHGLKRMIDVGLDYLRLGQPANTLSGGESQRLKLAAHLSGAKKGRCLFLLDEPTTGLHFADIVQLLDCFEALLSVGHSLIVIEHNLQILREADHLIDLGPGAAEAGGRVVATGTPEEVAMREESVTAEFLRAELNGSAPLTPPEPSRADNPNKSARR